MSPKCVCEFLPQNTHRYFYSILKRNLFMWSNFQHYSILQYHMILQKSFKCTDLVLKKQVKLPIFVNVENNSTATMVVQTQWTGNGKPHCKIPSRTFVRRNRKTTYNLPPKHNCDIKEVNKFSQGVCVWSFGSRCITSGYKFEPVMGL